MSNNDTLETPATSDKALRMNYRIGRGEQGVLTFEPYKSALLPLWRFRTVEIARKSSADLWRRFEEYERQGDFVGMDMSRKMLQMVRSIYLLHLYDQILCCVAYFLRRISRSYRNEDVLLMEHEAERLQS